MVLYGGNQQELFDTTRHMFTIALEKAFLHGVLENRAQMV